MSIVISEFGSIKKASDYELPQDSFSEVFVSDKIFNSIKDIAFAYANDLLFTFSVQKGKEQIKVKNYVGVIQTADNVQIEILPKSTASSSKEARKIFLKMLQRFHSYQSLSHAHLAISHLPLFEIFVRVFLDELDKLFILGLGRNYEKIEGNEVYVKGKVLVNENIRQNLFRTDTVFISYDAFLHDIAQNRILKTCLQHLDTYTFTSHTKRRIWQCLSVFEEVSSCKNIYDDLMKSQVNTPIFERYDKVLHWSKIFLNHQSFLPFSGNHLQIALLFPMEALFENYVGKLFQKYTSNDFIVRLQDREKHLIDKHIEKSRFRLIPDIVLEKINSTPKEVLIFDTKWKLIDNSRPKQNYSIEQTDLYQMYAYGKKYGSQKLFLIYPANEDFMNPLEVFDYEDHMTLRVLPFNLLNDGEEELRKIML